MGFWGLYVLDRDEKKSKRHLIGQKVHQGEDVKKSEKHMVE